MLASTLTARSAWMLVPLKSATCSRSGNCQARLTPPRRTTPCASGHDASAQGDVGVRSTTLACVTAAPTSIAAPFVDCHEIPAWTCDCHDERAKLRSDRCTRGPAGSKANCCFRFRPRSDDSEPPPLNVSEWPRSLETSARYHPVVERPSPSSWSSRPWLTKLPPTTATRCVSTVLANVDRHERLATPVRSIAAPASFGPGSAS